MVQDLVVVLQENCVILLAQGILWEGSYEVN